MKNNQLKRGLALALVLAMIFTLFISVNIPTSAATYVYNWGQRGVDCTELSSYALAFYTGTYVFEDMSQTAGGSSQSNGHQSALYLELQTLMESKHGHETSYGETRDLYKYTDCQNGGGKISSFYSGASIGPSWDSGGTWNREHTWPNSKGLGGNDENDIMMLRPTSVSENSSRGNAAYGESSGYYNPNKESSGAYDLRGDCARITLYVYTRWGNTSNMWGQSGVMESLTVLLKWMEEDPVDTWEMGRNDAVQSITGTRNVFVDYPEYAWLLFGRDVPEDYVTPSGNAGVSGGNGGNGGSTGGDTGNNGGNGGSTGGDTGNNGGSTGTDEMTIAEALASPDGTICKVTGTVSSVEEWNSQYGNMNATITDGNGNEIYLYRIKVKVEVGESITVTGTRYTHYELKELKDFTSVEKNQGGADPSDTDIPTEPGEIESDSESDTLDGTDLEETGEVESQSSSENMTDPDIDTGADLDTGAGTPDNGDEVYTQEENRGDEIYTQEENRGDEIYTQEENQGDGNGGSGGNGGEPDSGAESNGGDDESEGGDGSKLGCGSSIGGGIAVIISISVGGALTLRRKREE